MYLGLGVQHSCSFFTFLPKKKETQHDRASKNMSIVIFSCRKYNMIVHQKYYCVILGISFLY